MSDIVNVRGLVKRYGEKLALDHFDLRIARGEIFGLLAPTAAARPPPSTACSSCSPTTAATSSSSASR